MVCVYLVRNCCSTAAVSKTKHGIILFDVYHRHIKDSIAIQLNRKLFPDTKFTGPTWGPPGSCRPQMGPRWPHEPCYQGCLFNIVVVHPQGGLKCDSFSLNINVNIATGILLAVILNPNNTWICLWITFLFYMYLITQYTHKESYIRYRCRTFTEKNLVITLLLNIIIVNLPCFHPSISVYRCF